MEDEVRDLWELLVRQRGAPEPDQEPTLSWDELDHDVLATLPVRQHRRYLWDGRFAPASDVVREVDERTAHQYGSTTC